MNTPPMPVTFSISAAFWLLSWDADRVDQRQPAARSNAPTVIIRSVFMVIVDEPNGRDQPKALFQVIKSPVCKLNKHNPARQTWTFCECA
jgi:hypothetical protein